MAETALRRWRDLVPQRLWILLGLCVVLSAIGFAQFRWIDEVARAQREHTVSALHASLARFTSDFDTEIARIHFAFQIPLFDPGMDMRAPVQYRLSKWHELAPYPRLIEDVSYVEAAGGDEEFPPGRVLRLAGRSAFPPGGRAGMGIGAMESGRGREYIIRSGGGPAPAGVTFQTGAGVSLSAGPAIELTESADGSPRAVTITMPLIPGIPRMIGEGGTARAVTMAMFHGTARIRLDLDYIRREFIPQLVERAFSEQRAEVQILVSSANARQIVWTSEPDAYAAQQGADLSAGFLSLRPGCVANALNGGALGPARFGQAQDGWLRQVLGQRTPACDQQPLDKLAGHWKISVRYRAGSVDAVISRFRNRSLGLSLGVLLILFVAALMLVWSTERARNLAKVQMEFAAGVSHELRTPLSVIRVAADNLSQGMVEDGPQARRYGSLISAQVQHLSALIADVLLFSNSSASLEIQGMRAAAVETIVDDALAHCAADLEQAGFQVKRELRNPLPEIQASPHLATQCLVNIVQNAIKYAPAGKFVGIVAAACESGGVPGVRIDVLDHGNGIRQDELSHVFEPFYRGREARSSQTSGLGLGLSIVKRIVDGHRGQIKVLSRPGAHTKFSIWLPAAAAVADSAVASGVPAAPAART